MLAVLSTRVIENAIMRGIKSMHSSESADNDLMRKFAKHLRFEHQRDLDNAKLVLYIERPDPTEADSQLHVCRGLRAAVTIRLVANDLSSLPHRHLCPSGS